MENEFNWIIRGMEIFGGSDEFFKSKNFIKILIIFFLFRLFSTFCSEINLNKFLQMFF